MNEQPKAPPAPDFHDNLPRCPVCGRQHAGHSALCATCKED